MTKSSHFRSKIGWRHGLSSEEQRQSQRSILVTSWIQTIMSDWRRISSQTANAGRASSDHTKARSTHQSRYERSFNRTSEVISKRKLRYNAGMFTTPGLMFSIRNIPKPTKMGGYGMNWFCKHHGVFRGSKCCATTFRRSLARSLRSFSFFFFYKHS